MTTLRFIGDLSVWYGVPLALAAAWAAWRLYRRETRARGGAASWGLPALRSGAAAMLVLMLTGPVLHHRLEVGRTGRVLVAADATASMGVNDPALSAGRRLLGAVSLGFCPADLVDRDLPAAGAALLRAQAAALELIRAKPGAREFEKTRTELIRDVQNAIDHVGERLRPDFRAEVLEPAYALERMDGDGAAAPLAALAETMERWRGRIALEAEARAETAAQSGKPEIAEALRRFDAMTRWQRAQALLTDGAGALLGDLARENHVDLLAIDGAATRPLWSGPAGSAGAARPIPIAALPGGTTALATGLDAALRAALGRREIENAANAKQKETVGREPLALLLLSDGRHNFGESPLALARTCAEQGIPIFTVGYGPDKSLQDLAVDRVEAPQWVYHKDNLKGKIYLKDDMPAGKAFTLRIRCGDRVLWEQQVQTTGEHARAVDFEFSAEAYLNERAAAGPAGLTLRSASLDLRAEATGLGEADREPRNNTAAFHARATFHRNRILVLDGRPRWEFRYLRDLFERDAKWEVTTLVADPLAPGGGLKRGDGPDAFPATREALFSYDLVFLGDFPAALLRPDEQGWLKAFVAERGGGLIMIDGDRKNLRGYGAAALGELVPVAWGEEASAGAPAALRLTEKGKLRLTRLGMDTAALALAPDMAGNAAIWDALLPPHWLAPVRPLPGAEVLLEAVVDGRALPALVSRRYGAGKVLYAAFDETWRFRYRVAERHHSRYWSQVAGWIMTPAYAASDRFVSLDAGPLIYNAGSAVELRGRVRDNSGKTILNARVTARLARDGRDVAAVPLEPDAESGEYRATVTGLAPGHYEMRLEAGGVAADGSAARTDFFIQAAESGELTELSCDEELLGRIASESGGEYFREENARQAVARIRPFLRPRIVESETALWQSYVWFGAIALLLTIEWIWRKRAGMI